MVSLPPRSVAPTPPDCPHELAPGVTVCLRCRQEARRASVSRQRGVVFGTGALLVVAIAAVVTLVVHRNGGERPLASRSPDGAALALTAESGREPSATAGRSVPPRSSSERSLAVPPGRTALGRTVFVERAGDSAVVSFDEILTRTRRSAKFESLLRRTLPTVYGSWMDSVLRAIPEGRLVPVPLIPDVVTTGIRIETGSGLVVVFPDTRPGQDGPLVVRYRTSLRPRDR